MIDLMCLSTKIIFMALENTTRTNTSTTQKWVYLCFFKNSKYKLGLQLILLYFNLQS